MAQIVRCRIAQIFLKYSCNSVSRCTVPVKYQRSCFHTSWLLNVKGKEVLMPSLSPTMETGTIVKWIKKEGEVIQPGDALADIQTDKAVMTFELEEDGILARIIVPEGTKDIKVGTLIALTVESDEDWKSVEIPSDIDAPISSALDTNSETTSMSASEPPPGQVNVTMPALSPTMTSGTIVKWLKKEGDEINPGDAIAEIQTDKAVITYEIDEEAIMAKILAEEGVQIEVGKLIALTVEKGMDWKSAVIPTLIKTVAKNEAPATPSTSAVGPKNTPEKSQPPPSGQVYGLAVKRLLEEYGLSSGSIKGTGRPNRLLKSDILAYIQANNIQRIPPSQIQVTASPSVPPTVATTTASTRTKISASPKSGPSTYKDIEVSNIRAVIAKRLGESKSTIPHSYTTVDINIDKLNDLRSKLKAESIKVSVNDFITKAVAHALLQCPDINCLYRNGETVRLPNVDISVAVSTPTGLITPIVFNTPTKSLTEISNDVKVLASKAREGTLKPNEFQGGSFTISNLGMFGIKEFSAIINPPQTAILAVGTGREILDTSLTRTCRMSATLSYDSRAIDEDQAANFMSTLRSMLEDPSFLMIGRGQQLLRHKRE